jgi:chromosomal replication initiator protein
LELPAHLELLRAWRQIREDLRRTVGDSTFDIWLATVDVAAWDGSVLLLQAPPETRAWISDRFTQVIEHSARALLGPAARISFTTAQPARTVSHPPDADPLPLQPLTYFNPRYNFAQFVMGEGNRLAHAAALAVAENPGHAYNPLFLHGPPGLGKTHLLHAIANYIAAFSDTTAVHYTTVEAFTNSFLAALHSRSLDRFKHIYRNVDVLLIDDVQFLASKVKTEEEFFHTFNAVYDSGRQLVLTCDRLPTQLLAIEERLRDRFQSGLVAEISPPDHATRVAILRKRVALDEIEIADPAVIDLIAHRITDNIRTLEGAFIRLVANHSLTGHPIDSELTRRTLDEIRPLNDASAQLQIADIQAAVAQFFQLTAADLVSPSRAAAVAWPRHLAIALCRELTADPLTAIGAAFGGRSHATVLNACRRVSDRIASDGGAAADLASLRALLTPQIAS